MICIDDIQKLYIDIVFAKSHMYTIPQIDSKGFDSNGQMDSWVYFANVSIPSTGLPHEVNKAFLEQELDRAEISIKVNKALFGIEGTIEAELDATQNNLGAYFRIKISEEVVNKLIQGGKIDFHYELLEKEQPQIMQQEALR
jgi:hypothetical protein